MIQTLANAFKVPDLRKKMTYLLGAFLMYSVAAHIPVPNIDPNALEAMFGDPKRSGTLFGMWDLFAGGSLRRFSILAVGITPYINASIIMQLLTVVIPRLEDLAKEGESGRKIISTWTRYMTIALSFLQSYGMFVMLGGQNLFRHDTIPFFSPLVVVITLVGGTAFLMWLGEEISQKGIGNGVSLIIFIGIVNSLPQQFGLTFKQASLSGNWLGFVGLLIMSVATVAFIIYIHVAERKIPVQYAKRVVGRKVYGGQTTYIPLKVNTAGVIPIIFAISLLMLPATIAQFIPFETLRAFALSFPTSALYNVAYFLLVFVFTYFYTAVIFNPKDVADRMKKHGGFILGIRPGKPTAEYLERIMVRITFIGGLFLGFIAVLPSILVGLTNLTSFSLGGTSLLIVVGVALDTMRNLEAQLLMRHYEGF